MRANQFAGRERSKRFFARGRINEWRRRARKNCEAKQAARATLFLLVGLRRMPGAAVGRLLRLCFSATAHLPSWSNGLLRRDDRERDRAREQERNDNVERRSHAPLAYATVG